MRDIAKDYFAKWQEWKTLGHKIGPLEQQVRKLKKQRDQLKKEIVDHFGRHRKLATPMGTTLQRETVRVTPKPYKYERIKEVQQ